MTRSRKKTPCCHIVKKQPWYKKHFNRKLRREPVDWREGVSSLPDGNAYRKANESWDIDDFKSIGLAFDDSAFDDRNQYEKWYVRK